MTDYPACPLTDCTYAVPHPHLILGEGLWGPRPVDGLASVGEAVRGGDPEKLGEAMKRVERTVPCRCKTPGCRNEWQGTEYLPLQPGQTYVLRTCNACLDVIEARLVAKAAASERKPTAKPRAPSAPLRTPYKDD